MGKTVIAFNVTHSAIAAQKVLEKHGINFMTIPTPRTITASCGISLMLSADDTSAAVEALRASSLDEKSYFVVEGF